jgi:hypothetical protein
MKTSKLVVSIVFATLVLLTAASAQTKTQATIPFDFIVMDQTLPAGVYGLTMVGVGVLHINRLDGPGGALVVSYAAHSRQDAPNRILFHRYGNRYFLSQAWIGDTCHALALSDREREYARTIDQQPVSVLASTAK